jgi:type IV pilus assembly protein PilM
MANTVAKLTDKLQVLRSGPELHLPRIKRPKSGGAGEPEAAQKPRSRLNADVHLPRLGKGAPSEGLVGLEIEADSVAVAEVRGDSELATTAIAPLPPGAFKDGEVVDPDAIAAVLKSVFAQHKLSKRVRLGVANQRVVVRTIQLPQIDDPVQLSAAVRFQAEEQIPMPIEQAVLDHRVIGRTVAGEQGGAMIDVVVSAARREMISSVLRPLRAAGLTPVGIDLSAFGLIRALAAQPVASGAEGAEGAEPAIAETVLYCSVGDPTTLAIARGRACLFTRVSQVGLEEAVRRLAAKTGLPPEDARLWLVHVGLGAAVDEIEGDPNAAAETRAALEESANSLVSELRLSIDFYAAQEGAAPVDRVVLGGPGAAIPGIVEHLTPLVGIPIELGRPTALSGSDPVAAARLTLPYGLALQE